MERRDVADRQFDALLERLDRIAVQLEKIDRRLEAGGVDPDLERARSLEESLNALAYAALGQARASVVERRSWAVHPASAALLSR